ncbi:MAG: ferrous iron transport protein B [Verrucomicrobiota bacterium]|nr:ferrous iron transport protein B [Verrucomicrobiota bacterium]
MNQAVSQPTVKKTFTIALAGNPNSGKTTIFNALTGAHQHVGNYPGVTVEKKEGATNFQDTTFTVVDLPGTYSLTAYSIEEIVARNFLIEDKPDAVVDIVDASNLERNLYLAVQLMELGAPLVLALNMSDVARDRGLQINYGKLSELLGVPVLPTVGHKGRGIQELLATVADVCRKSGRENRRLRQVNYGHEIEPHVEQFTKEIAGHKACADRARWYALKLLEGDGETAKRIRSLHPHGCEEMLQRAVQLRQHIEKISGADIGAVLADGRYGFIAGARAEAVSQTAEARVSRSEKVDRVVLSRWLGLPVFAALMYAVFQLTFTIGEPLMGGMEAAFEWLGGAIASFWPEGADSLFKSLLTDGIIGGVGGVLVFLPNILLLFLAIAVLEDTGYMARAAFIMDRLMHKIGLHGKSFIPMLIGFGCTIPAIMATRTLETRRDRLTTILVLPLISCGARLPIYALIIPAFFPQAWQAPMLWTIYIIGIVLAVVLAKLLRATLFKGEAAPFVMELPPYHMPTLRGLLLHMWERCWLFLRKAGTIILGISILMWALSVWPKPGAERMKQFEQQRAAVEAQSYLDPEHKQAMLTEIDHAAGEAELEHSAIRRIGRFIAPALRPLGFDWKVSTAMLGAFAAKEVFVAQMGIVHAVGEADEQSETLRAKLQATYTPLQGFCIMLFCLISTPCMATVAVTKRESGSWKWALLQLSGLTLVAWAMTAAVYQIGQLLIQAQ